MPQIDDSVGNVFVARPRTLLLLLLLLIRLADGALVVVGFGKDEAKVNRVEDFF